MKEYKKVLTIAGSDSGGGAGIQADIKSISACGCYAASAITAITVQNTLGVEDVFEVPPSILGAQIDAVLGDIGAEAVKIGMLHSSQIITLVREKLLHFGITNIVLDPVMVSTSGHKLIEDEAIATLKSDLVGIAKVVTPNIPEAEILLGKKIDSQNDLPEFAKSLSEIYSKECRVSVLLKAGHLSEENLIDVFYNAETCENIFLESVRVHTRNTHGTGCTLSSALAAYIARGYSLNDAAKAAKNYINEAIISGKEYKIGHGFGPVDHFFTLH